jgi:hypothetical protein
VRGWATSAGLLCVTALAALSPQPASPGPQGVSRKARKAPVLFWTAKPTISPRELMPRPGRLRYRSAIWTCEK